MKNKLFILTLIVFCLQFWSIVPAEPASKAGLTQQVTQAAPVKGGHLAVSLPAEPPGLDPTVDTSTTTHLLVYANIYESLIKIGKKGNLEPSLAESWSISGGGRVYTFRLNQRIKYHNNERFNSHVADWNLKRTQAKGNHKHLKGIIKIESPDPYTLVVTLKEPDSLFLAHLSEGEALMLPKKGYGPAITYPIGTGPFKFIQWVRGDRLEMARYKNYRNRDLPYLDKVTFKFIPDPKARLAALKTGEVDVVMGYSASPKSALDLARDERFKVLTGLSTGEVILSINNKAKPFNDLRIRQALTMAINREEVIKEAMYGFGEPIGSHWSPVTPYYVNLTGLYPYNPEKALKLLKEAGYPKGFDTVMKLPAPYTYLQRTGVALAKMLGRVGVHVDLKVIPWEEWNKQVFKNKDYQLAVVSHTEPWDINLYADPENYIQYDSELFRKAYSQALKALSEEQKKKYFELCQRIIAEDAASGFLFSMPTLQIMRVEVMDWWENYPTKIMDLTRVWLKEPE
ncbi:MAG: ABC transporter substrate-binding protein [Deltaproteobacteria bacterium]|nr:ABC transporter substrate-binding protein [Deltaproteobacteria bacterium]MBW2050740.1 ABC transporter substrate-binding protein [Deltaproteobacteria bacterium]MBW2142054.1 ABC transporter substrate-binding protein [Deltaproteobacteria bacterium]MBW2324620.1 ABC transporter substrate-binding protein [Deltaproteobacteria bacterium]